MFGNQRGNVSKILRSSLRRCLWLSSCSCSLFSIISSWSDTFLRMIAMFPDDTSTPKFSNSSKTLPKSSLPLVSAAILSIFANIESSSSLCLDLTLRIVIGILKRLRSKCESSLELYQEQKKSFILSITFILYLFFLILVIFLSLHVFK